MPRRDPTNCSSSCGGFACTCVKILAHTGFRAHPNGAAPAEGALVRRSWCGDRQTDLPRLRAMSMVAGFSAEGSARWCCGSIWNGWLTAPCACPGSGGRFASGSEGADCGLCHRGRRLPHRPRRLAPLQRHPVTVAGDGTPPPWAPSSVMPRQHPPARPASEQAPSPQRGLRVPVPVDNELIIDIAILPARTSQRGRKRRTRVPCSARRAVCGATRRSSTELPCGSGPVRSR